MESLSEPKLAVDGEAIDGPLFRGLDEDSLGDRADDDREPRRPPDRGRRHRARRPGDARAGRRQLLFARRGATTRSTASRSTSRRSSRATRLVAVLDVTTTESQGARLVLDDPLPAGFEIDNPHMLSGGDVAALDWLNLVDNPAHVEFRADRFVAAWDLPTDGTTQFQFAYIVRAVSPGTFAASGGADRGHVPAGAPRAHGHAARSRWSARCGRRRRCCAASGASASPPPLRGGQGGRTSATALRLRRRSPQGEVALARRHSPLVARLPHRARRAARAEIRGRARRAAAAHARDRPHRRRPQRRAAPPLRHLRRPLAAAGHARRCRSALRQDADRLRGPALSRASRRRREGAVPRRPAVRHARAPGLRRARRSPCRWRGSSPAQSTRILGGKLAQIADGAGAGAAADARTRSSTST